MSDLASRVLAAIDRVEQAALNAGTAPWVATVPGMVHVDPVAIRDNRPAFGSLGYVATVPIEGYRNHIADNDPPTVLRRCAADRRTVDRYLDADRQCKAYTVKEKDETLTLEVRKAAWTSANMWNAVAVALLRTILDIAEGYGIAAHPDSREQA